MTGWDAVVPRVGASLTLYGCAVVRQFEQMGVFTLASSHAISVARDKLRSIQVLSRHTVGFPPTVFIQDPSRVAEALDEIGGPPAVMKVLEGTQGVGVILVDSVKNAQAILETLQMARQHVILQKFVVREPGPRPARVRGRRPGGRRDAAGRPGRRVPRQRPPRRPRREGRAAGRLRDRRDPRRPDPGAAGRRRRHARVGRGAQGHRGQLVARPRGHRERRPASTSPAR